MGWFPGRGHTAADIEAATREASMPTVRLPRHRACCASFAVGAPWPAARPLLWCWPVGARQQESFNFKPYDVLKASPQDHSKSRYNRWCRVPWKQFSGGRACSMGGAGERPGAAGRTDPDPQHDPSKLPPPPKGPGCLQRLAEGLYSTCAKQARRHTIVTVKYEQLGGSRPLLFTYTQCPGI